MKAKKIDLNGAGFLIPDYYQQVESMPEDPDNSTPFLARTENTICFILAQPVDMSQSLPRTKEDLISGIRECLGPNQGLIEVKAEKDYVFSIIKSLMDPGGVEYTLTYQRFFSDFILQIHGFFEETRITGQRDSVVFELCRRQGIVGTEDGIFKGWSCDPYDKNIHQGKLMNISEHEEYDSMFPRHPISMCREFIRVLTSR